MPRKGKSKKGNTPRVPKRSRSFPGIDPLDCGGNSRLGEEAHEERESWYSSAWNATRSGSRASRGFHFQDVVGAWLASRLAAGELGVDRIVPEGFDDLQLEADEPVQVEVKSRQGRLGPFPVRRAARLIIDAWLRHAARFGTGRRLVVVLEGGLAAWEENLQQPVTEIPLSRLIDCVAGLEASLSAEAESHEEPSTVTGDMLFGTTVVACSWDGLIAETERHLELVVNLPTAALGVTTRALQVMVANTVDSNAEARFEDRSSIDRTDVIDYISKIAELIDLESLGQAITQGICSPVDKEPIETGDYYYEGVSTQPGHVAAGLVVPRQDIVSQTMAGLDISQAVLLVGPSGVGKSAVLWTVPFALPGVLWFRVHRLTEDDVPHVVRLLRANRVSPKAPVGLLFDALGNGDFTGWSRLRQSLVSVPGALIVGTARSEDLLTLGDLADCRTVGVELDEEAAEAIHAGLARRGATSVPHWREAFEQSHGLTLEFTHKLTQGARLHDILADQISRRVNEGRSIELQVLALVAVADRWSVSIPAEMLNATLDTGLTEIRTALARLVEEHLVVEQEDSIGGIHQIRSRNIVEVIHRIPPPTLQATVASVLAMLHGPALSRFLYEVLTDAPDLENPVLRVLEILVQDDIERLLACLRGLELLDFQRQATAWAQIAEQHEVPLAQRPSVLHLAVSGVDVPDFFPANIQEAVAEMASLPEQSATRNLLLSTVDAGKIALELAAATSVEECSRLLVPLGRTSIDWRQLLAALQPGSPFVTFLKNCLFSELVECVSLARGLSVDLAKEFVDAIGGTERLLENLRISDPWLRDLRIVSSDGELVGVARFLYASESDQGDPREYAVETGRRLLRMLPEIDRVDVKAVFPEGRTLEGEGTDYASSGLLRRYDHHATTVGWNQDRMRVTQTLFGASETLRLAEGAKLLFEVEELVRDIGNVFVQSRGGPLEVINGRRMELAARGQSLPPQIGSSPLSENPGAGLNDPLSGTISDICGNLLTRLANRDGYPALLAFVNQKVLGEDISALRKQPWRLVGFEGDPPVLDILSAGLSDIAAVLAQLHADPGSARRIVDAGRHGPRKGALSRAANLARQLTLRRIHKQRVEVRRALQSERWEVDVFWADYDPKKSEPSSFAVTVALDSLLDLPAAFDEFLPKLRELGLPGEAPLLVPVVKGRSVIRFSVRVATNDYAASDFGEFEHLLPLQLEQRLSNPVLAAFSALRVYSALSLLRRGDGLHPKIREVSERTLSEYDNATTAIRAYGEDAVVADLTRWLREIQEQVDREWSGEISPGTFASSIEGGVAQPLSPESKKLAAALLLSLQWDSDSAPAIALSESSEK